MSQYGPRSRCPYYGWMSRERVDALEEWQNLPDTGWVYGKSDVGLYLERQPDNNSLIEVGHRGTLSIPTWKIENWTRVYYVWLAATSNQYLTRIWWGYKVLPFGLVVRTTNYRYFLAPLNWWCRC